jgi:hypothetical protein
MFPRLPKPSFLASVQRAMRAASRGELIAASACAGCTRIVFFAEAPLVFGDTNLPDLACVRKSCRNFPSL